MSDRITETKNRLERKLEELRLRVDEVMRQLKERLKEEKVKKVRESLKTDTQRHGNQ